VEFLETFDPVQVRYVGGDWRRVVEYAERVARVVGMVCGLSLSLEEHMDYLTSFAARSCDSPNTICNDPTGFFNRHLHIYTSALYPPLS